MQVPPVQSPVEPKKEWSSTSLPELQTAKMGRVSARLEIPKSKKLSAAIDNFLYWVSPEPNSGCWPWTGCLSLAGYGCFQGFSAHRFSYAALVGPIPQGLTIDHLCRVRLCVNPLHLEPVTHKVNCQRKPKHPNRKVRNGAITSGDVGRLGGAARAARLSKQERSSAASLASKARWNQVRRDQNMAAVVEMTSIQGETKT